MTQQEERVIHQKEEVTHQEEGVTHQEAVVTHQEAVVTHQKERSDTPEGRSLAQSHTHTTRQQGNGWRATSLAS